MKSKINYFIESKNILVVGHRNIVYNSIDGYVASCKYSSCFPLFKKGKSFLKSHPSFQSFEEGKENKVYCKGMAYVPEKIMALIIFTDVPIENKFPHITALVGSYSPKNSNDVLSELFGDGKELEKLYEKMKDNLAIQEFVQKVNCEILGKKEWVYVIALNDPIIIDTRMKMYC